MPRAPGKAKAQRATPGPLRAIDLCCGAGGWACAARGTGVEIVAAVDFWDVACQTYRLNHPAADVICQDLRDPACLRLLAEKYTGVDLILGGVPCEWLSVRRNVGNAPDAAEKARERATLAAVLGLVERLAPRWWCIEDVKGLTRELPEGVPWIQINSADFSAQARKRVYVGRFPRPGGVGPLIGGQSRAVLGDCLRPGPFRIGKRTFGRRPAQHNTFAGDVVYACHAHRKGPTVCCFSSRRDAEVAVIDARVPGGLRQLEWQEAARLQGFPEDYLFYGSPHDVWQQVGRAVQVDTGRAILQAIAQEAGLV